MVWIKVCGIKDYEEACRALDAGVDALGFNFAAGPRRITPDLALSIIRRLPKGVDKVGVFLDQSMEELAAVTRLCRLNMVQLHGQESLDYIEALPLPETVKVIKVLHVDPRLRSAGAEAWCAGSLVGNYSPARAPAVTPARHWAQLAESARLYRNSPKVYALLVDSLGPGLVGGTGKTFDWSWARRLVEQGHRVVVAGGLNPDNVASAVRAVGPYGVDVASGVESGGRKDAQKLEAFVRAARSQPRTWTSDWPGSPPKPEMPSTRG